MKLIAAVDKNWAIGNKGQLLVSIPQDQKMFRDETMGKVIVMGRKTLESLPGSTAAVRPDEYCTYDRPGLQGQGSFCMRQRGRSDGTAAVLIIRMMSISSAGKAYTGSFCPYCDEAQITWIDFAYAADTHFPNLDQNAAWEMVQESDEQTYFDLCYEYRLYKKK